jgi:hypothetical protein
MRRYRLQTKRLSLPLFDEDSSALGEGEQDGIRSDDCRCRNRDRTGPGGGPEDLQRPRRLLQRGDVFGVYSEPLRQRACLAAAREAIERAEKIMQETAWPAPEDYK